MNAGNLQTFISIFICPAISRYDDQAVDDTSEESGGKKTFIVQKSLWPVPPTHGIVEQAEQNGELRPQ